MSCAFTMYGSKLAWSLLVLIWKGGCGLQDTLEALGTCTQETTYIIYTKLSAILLIQLFQSSECRLPLAGMTIYKLTSLHLS